MNAGWVGAVFPTLLLRLHAQRGQALAFNGVPEAAESVRIQDLWVESTTDLDASLLLGSTLRVLRFGDAVHEDLVDRVEQRVVPSDGDRLTGTGCRKLQIVGPPANLAVTVELPAGVTFTTSGSINVTVLLEVFGRRPASGG